MNVRVESDGHAGNTHVLDDAGKKIGGIGGIQITIKPRDIVHVHLDLVKAEISVAGEAKASLMGREIKRIIYADGGEEEF